MQIYLFLPGILPSLSYPPPLTLLSFSLKNARFFSVVPKSRLETTVARNSNAVEDGPEMVVQAGFVSSLLKYTSPLMAESC